MMPAVENPSLAKIPPFLPPLDNKLKSSSEHIKNNGSCRKTKNVQTENHIHHEVADIFRLYGAEYRRTHNLSIEQHNVIVNLQINSEKFADKLRNPNRAKTRAQKTCPTHRGGYR